MSLKQKSGLANRERSPQQIAPGTKIIALMKHKGLSQTALAVKYSVQMESINRSIWGVRSGARLRSAIAYELGYESWQALKESRVIL